MLQESILQYFWPALSYHLSLRPLFCLFLSGHFRQVLLYSDAITSQHSCIRGHVCGSRSIGFFQNPADLYLHCFQQGIGLTSIHSLSQRFKWISKLFVMENRVLKNTFFIKWVAIAIHLTSYLLLYKVMLKKFCAVFVLLSNKAS